MRHVTIHFAGLARDCEDCIEDNVESLLTLCDASDVAGGKLLIAENDSTDNTREILRDISSREPNVELFLLDGLDRKFDSREGRLAYLRQFLLETVRESTLGTIHEAPQLYIPIDLDGEIARSIQRDEFFRECVRVAYGDVNAVFPVTEPYYYDIYALRAEGWVEYDSMDRIKKLRKRRGLFLARYDAVYKKQKSIEQLQAQELYQVRSAFGGLGIYDLQSALSSSYFDPRDPSGLTQCEHVEFNDGIKNKVLSTDFVLAAPEEHIKQKLSVVHLLESLFNSVLDDINSAIKYIKKHKNVKSIL